MKIYYSFAMLGLTTLPLHKRNRQQLQQLISMQQPQLMHCLRQITQQLLQVLIQRQAT
jgi:hypothetical protein